MELIGLDNTDVKKLAQVSQMLSDLEVGGVRVRTASIDIYDEHRVRFARVGGRYGTVRITKIEKLAR